MKGQGCGWGSCGKLTYKLSLVDTNDSYPDGLMEHILEHAGWDRVHGVPGKRRPENAQGQRPSTPGPRCREEGTIVVRQSSRGVPSVSGGGRGGGDRGYRALFRKPVKTGYLP